MGEKARILIVDDNEAICKTMKNIFQAKNYVVEIVHSGKDAIAANKKQKFNVAILDLRLPDMDGIAILTELSKENADIGVIMITGFASIETAVGALTKGAEAFIVKPLNMDEVLNTVNRVVEKQRLTRQKQEVEEQLRESELRHRMVLSSMNDLIFVLDKNNDYVEFYTSGEIDLVAPVEEQLGSNVKDVLPSELAQRIIDCANRVRKEGKREEVEYSLTIGNRRNWYSAMLDIHQDGESIVQTVRNITLRKTAEAEIKTREKELEIYASLLRHDLSNDLGVIFGNIDIARLLFDEGENEELIDTIDSIEAICNRMKSLITVFSRPVDSIESDLFEQLKSIVATTKTVNPNLTVNIHAQGASENLSVPASRLLAMVWENLIRNATEHAGENSIVDIQISREDNMVHVVVSDNGPGVSEKVRKKLFQKGVTTQEGGLGLYLSKQIIQMIGGSIEFVTDESVQGAKFKIILPIVPE